MKPIALLAALAAAALAQHWDIEQVDSAAHYARDVYLRRLPDNSVSLCYNFGNGSVIVAHKDSVWHRDSVAFAGYGSAFDVGPNGEVGIAYGRVLDTTVYVYRTDSGWASESFSMRGFWCTRLSYDRIGRPFVLETDGNFAYGALRTDTGWAVELVMPQTPGTIGEGGCSHGQVQFDRDNHPWVCCGEDLEFNMYNWWGYVHVRTKGDDTWEERTTLGGLHQHAAGFSLVLDTSDTPRTCYYLSSAVVCDGDTMADYAGRAVMRLDQLDQPHVVCDFSYAYRTPAGWHIHSFEPRWAMDFVFDAFGQPIVALAGPDGVWLACGVDIVGQSEEKGRPTPFGSRLTASVVRNVLLLPEAASLRSQAVGLLDASGRKVLDLKAGANDVSRLSPGVYFVREAQVRAVRKVVITR